MIIDNYTKFVLTFIALGLFLNAMKPDPISKALAQTGGHFTVNLSLSNQPSGLIVPSPFEVRVQQSK